ncbi:MAG: MFS transporter [Alphaproteobacteria bacterium]|nr:MFS transporter [Alphaproteobacteria bacterium]MBV8409256.1 MFS transporter [Alphaproteobacteria bacterium]
MACRVGSTFASLRHRNFRRYLVAQVGSNVGGWIQITAETWLVLELAHSGLALGITNALQFGPLVVMGLYGGVIADRFQRRRLLIATQSALALLAFAMGLLVATGLIELWMIWLAALLLGVVMSVDRPALLSFVKDLAGEEALPNAVALNNAATSAGRMLGPVAGGTLVATVGSASCFFINAASFALVVLVLARLDVRQLQSDSPVARKPGQVREVLSLVRRDRILKLTVMAMSAVFVAAYNFQVLVPLLVSRRFDGSSALYGAAMSSLGLGAVAGSLLVASWAKPALGRVAAGGFLLCASYAGLALPLVPAVAMGGLFLLGVCCGFFNVTVAGILQLHAGDDSRGRLMSLYSIGILGSGLLGAPLAGALADHVGLAPTLLAIAAVCAATAIATACAQALSRRTGEAGR